MNNGLTARELAYCGLFGATALLLPVLFHLVHLGHVFLPMYLPLVALAFYVSPVAAASTAFIVPLLSGAVTGMPPFFPPVAAFMALELSFMAGVLSAIHTRWPRQNPLLSLLPTLLFGRVVYVLLVVLFSRIVELPEKFMAGLSLLGAWPGLILIAVAVPTLVRGVPSTNHNRSKEKPEVNHGQ